MQNGADKTDVLKSLSNTPLAQINNDWKHHWAPSIKSETARKAIESKERLAKRLIANIKQHAKDHMSLRDRSDNRLEPQDKQDLIKKFLNHKPADIARHIGLVLFSKTIKSCLNTPQATEMLRVITRDEIKFALEFQSVSLDIQSVELETLMKEIDRAGFETLYLWVQHFVDETAVALMVRLPKHSGDAINLPQEKAIETVDLVLQNLHTP